MFIILWIHRKLDDFIKIILKIKIMFGIINNKYSQILIKWEKFYSLLPLNYKIHECIFSMSKRDIRGHLHFSSIRDLL